MSNEGIIITLIMGAVIALWLALPLLLPDGVDKSRPSALDRQRARLYIYYERVLRNLHDIDEDFATGKLSPHEHRRERERWVRLGIEALKAIDQIDEQNLFAPREADDAAVDEAIDRAIETAIQQEQPATRQPDYSDN